MSRSGGGKGGKQTRSDAVVYVRMPAVLRASACPLLGGGGERGGGGSRAGGGGVADVRGEGAGEREDDVGTLAKAVSSLPDMQTSPSLSPNITP
jgi:hypothetical protein